MARRYYSSVAQRTSLTADITNSQTTIVVGAVTGFPASYPYTLIIDQDTINEEVVEVASRSGTTLTVTRGVDGTSGVAHSAGAVVNHGVSARDFDEPNAFINGTGVVTETMIATGAVTNTKIGSAAVTYDKVGSGAATVGQTLVADGSGGASWGAAASSGGGYPDIFLLMGA